MFRVRDRVPSALGFILGVLPFVLILVLYTVASQRRHAENPKDKLMPNLAQIAKGWDDVWRQRVGSYEDVVVAEGDTAASLADRISGDSAFSEEIKGEVVVGENVRVPIMERYFLKDTFASLRRLGLGMLIGVGIALTLGLLMGVFTPVEKLLYPVVAALAKIPPLAILPIIFIFQGIGEPAKITIIALGIAPTMILDILMRAKDIATELITKAYTLGASTLEVVFKVVLPQIWPSFLNAIRLALGPAWVFLIASEAIAADAGLGYRIFVVQRQLGMNVILIYVAWIMVIGLAIDAILRLTITRRYGWAEVK